MIGVLVTLPFVRNAGSDVLMTDDCSGSSGGDVERVEWARMSLILCGVVELNGNSSLTIDLTVCSFSCERDGDDLYKAVILLSAVSERLLRVSDTFWIRI